ncbi:MAG TPA: dihydrofolate reductase family protein, partial [bacterium]|nr:dihydrofolate reductase family protein [bacterium]
TDRSPLDLQQELNRMGYRNLYVDGGKTIHSFMRENLIDEWTITRIPIMLGAGIPLFDNTLEKETSLVHIATRVFSNGLVQSTYKKQ